MLNNYLSRDYHRRKKICKGILQFENVEISIRCAHFPGGKTHTLDVNQLHRNKERLLLCRHKRGNDGDQRQRWKGMILQYTPHVCQPSDEPSLHVHPVDIRMQFCTHFVTVACPATSCGCEQINVWLIGCGSNV